MQDLFVDIGEWPDGSACKLAGVSELELAMARVWGLTYWDDENVWPEERAQWEEQNPDALEGTGLAGFTRLLPCVSPEDAALIEHAYEVLSPFWDGSDPKPTWEEWLEALVRARRLLGKVQARSFLPLYEEVGRAHGLTLDLILSCTGQLALRTF